MKKQSIVIPISVCMLILQMGSCVFAQTFGNETLDFVALRRECDAGNTPTSCYMAAEAAFRGGKRQMGNEMLKKGCGQDLNFCSRQASAFVAENKTDDADVLFKYMCKGGKEEACRYTLYQPANRKVPISKLTPNDPDYDPRKITKVLTPEETAEREERKHKDEERKLARKAKSLAARYDNLDPNNEKEAERLQRRRQEVANESGKRSQLGEKRLRNEMINSIKKDGSTKF